jgi:hypothetical protein
VFGTQQAANGAPVSGVRIAGGPAGMAVTAVAPKLCVPVFPPVCLEQHRSKGQCACHLQADCKMLLFKDLQCHARGCTAEMLAIHQKNAAEQQGGGSCCLVY